MYAACQTGHQKIRYLFNHPNMRAKFTNTISNLFYSVRTLYLDLPLTPLYISYAFRVPLSTLSERTYFLNGP